MAQKRSSTVPDDPVTPERIERALVAVARLVVKRGPVYAPILERLERELINARRRDPVSHAMRILSAYEPAPVPPLPAPRALLPPPPR